jgi:hypothetical protein
MQEGQPGIRDRFSDWDTIFVSPKKFLVAVFAAHSMGFNTKPTYQITAEMAACPSHLAG